MIRNTGRYVGILAIACLLTSGVVAQDEGLLSVDLAASNPRIRPNAPIILMLETYWNGSSLLEGRFEVQLYADGHQLVSETASHDIVLTPGRQLIRMVIPGTGSRVAFGQDEVAIKFVGDSKEIDLKRYPLMKGQGDRSVSVCSVGRTDARPSAESEAMVVDSLRLGDLLHPQQTQGRISTVIERWEADDVPELPLLLCSFDMLLLRPEGLADLRAKQLDAILAWTRAGGSTCVLLSDTLKGQHVDFLNQLMAESADNPFVLSTSGALVTSGGAPPGVWEAHVELGRAAILDADRLPTDVDKLWWQTRQTAAFLWKLRREQRRSVDRMPRQEWVSLKEGAPNLMRTGRARNSQFHWRSVEGTDRFVSQLMPQDVKVVPMSLIGLVLFGYLLLIGPADYLVLGYFKLRRFTWLVFPVVTLLVAFLCLAISEHYLSSANSGGTVVVQDIGADGTVLRETGFQLSFLGKRQTVTTDVENAIFTPMDHNRLQVSSRRYYNYQPPRQSMQLATPSYAGRWPTRYTVRQELAQWSPQVNRTFRIGGNKQTSNFAWNDASLIQPGNHTRLREAVQRAWPDAHAFVLQGDQIHQITGTHQVFREPQVPLQWRGWARRQEAYNGQFAIELCRRNPYGLFSVISQMSPNAGDNFEDLTLLDASDEDQALLVIGVEEGDTLTLYRRLYTNLSRPDGDTP